MYIYRVLQNPLYLGLTKHYDKTCPGEHEAILNGIRPSPKATAGQEEPATLTLSKLRKGFPEDWTEQRKMFGME